MDRANTETAVTFMSDDGDTPAYALGWDETNTTLTLTPTELLDMGTWYNFTLSNNGQAADVYTLTLTSTWPATLPITRTARLFPQEQTAIPITLTAPLTATSSTPNLLQLTAYSTFDTAVSVTATLQTEIHWPVFLPIMSHN